MKNSYDEIKKLLKSSRALVGSEKDLNQLRESLIQRNILVEQPMSGPGYEGDTNSMGTPRPNVAADTIDLASANVWPITSPTYILLPTDPAIDKVDGSRNTMKFFDWAYNNGSSIASRLQYIPLPPSAHNLIRQSWNNVKAPDGSTIWKL
jgi:hypothetical protein